MKTFDVQSGQHFSKGQLIAAIDERDFLIRKERAEALYRQAEADYRRVANLYEKNNISGTSYERHVPTMPRPRPKPNRPPTPGKTPA